MSKRCELQKEYYQLKGNYKGSGKYSDEYVSWLEEQILSLRIHVVVPKGTLCELCNDSGMIEEDNEFRIYLCDCKSH